MEKNSFVIKQIDKYISKYGEVPPHWIFRPESHPYSTGWRQGAGEFFVEVFYTWFENNLKTKEERINFYYKYSPPPRWLASVIDDIWELEGWNQSHFNYKPYLEKLNKLGFQGTLEYEKDLADKKWLDKF